MSVVKYMWKQKLRLYHLWLRLYHLWCLQIEKNLKSLERCQSLEEIQRLYEAGDYNAVVHLLRPTLCFNGYGRAKHLEFVTSIPERPAQLLLLQVCFVSYKICSSKELRFIPENRREGFLEWMLTVMSLIYKTKHGTKPVNAQKIPALWTSLAMCQLLLTESVTKDARCWGLHGMNRNLSFLSYFMDEFMLLLSIWWLRTILKLGYLAYVWFLCCKDSLLHDWGTVDTCSIIAVELDHLTL